MKIIYPLALCLLIGSIGLSCSNKKEQTTDGQSGATLTQIVGLGKVVPEQGITALASPTAGIVERIAVAVGDSVREGDVIVYLNNTDESLATNQAQAQVSAQQRAVEASRTAINKDKLSLEEKQRLLNDARDLLAAGAVSGEEVRIRENEVKLAQEQLKRSESEWRLQQAQLNERQLAAQSQSQNLDKTTLRAPISGRVLSIEPKVGEALNRYETYATVAPQGQLRVKAEVDELFANRLTIGQACEIRLVGDTVAVANGQIVALSPDLKKKSLLSDGGTDFEDRRVREIEVSLDNLKQDLLIETKVECIIRYNDKQQ